MWLKIVLKRDDFLTPCGLVDRVNDGEIAQAFLTRSERLLVLQDAIGHVIHFSSEVIDRRKIALLDDVVPLNPQTQAAVPGSRVHTETRVRTHHPIVALMKIAITGAAVGQDSARESQLEM